MGVDFTQFEDEYSTLEDVLKGGYWKPGDMESTIMAISRCWVTIPSFSYTVGGITDNSTGSTTSACIWVGERTLRTNMPKEIQNINLARLAAHTSEGATYADRDFARSTMIPNFGYRSGFKDWAVRVPKELITRVDNLSGSIGTGRHYLRQIVILIGLLHSGYILEKDKVDMASVVKIFIRGLREKNEIAEEMIARLQPNFKKKRKPGDQGSEIVGELFQSPHTPLNTL